MVLNRRQFVQAFAGAVATVAIGMRVSQGMPILEPQTALFQPTAGTVAMKVKVNMDHGLDVQFIDWRCMYGSPSGLDVKVDNA